MLLYRYLQGYQAKECWTPEVVPSLWISVCDDNVWNPDVYGKEEMI
jgi:hypothetical protein